MRRSLDQYFTPISATKALVSRILMKGRFLECCSGDGAIAEVLRSLGTVQTNDIDPSLPADFHEDATGVDFWKKFWYGDRRPDWVVSNPPFSVAQPIIEYAYETAVVGVVMLLRLSYLEPCKNRASWLVDHTPNSTIVLPRISFTGNGKTDSVTCAWFVWLKHSLGVQVPPLAIVQRG